MNSKIQPSPLCTITKASVLLSMGITYAMGTFNDNFFKQAALLLAAKADLVHIQGWATILFAMPFVVFSAWAGWLADRFPKRNLVIWSKALELAAMGIAVWTLLTLNWSGMVAVIFLMGLQSTIFSPALNGAIPELFPSERVPRVNALLKLATTATILLGIALAGVALEISAPQALNGLSPNGMFGFGRILVSSGAVLVALVGFITAFGVGKTLVSQGEKNPFPLLGPIDSARHALECRKNDPGLFVVLLGEGFFYGFSSFAVLSITNLGVRELGLSLTVTSLLAVALMVGVCIGALLAGKQGPESWRRLFVPAGSAMGTGLVLVGFAPLLAPETALAFLIMLFTATGIAGGMFLIPLISYIQVRPVLKDKGKILGVSNFTCFSSIILSGLVLKYSGHIAPSLLLVGCGVCALAFMVWAARKISRLQGACLADSGLSLLGILLRAVLWLRYDVRVRGLDAIPSGKGILFLPNHPALIDPLIVYSRIAGVKPRPLSDERQMGNPLGKIAAKLLRAVLIPDLRKDGPKAKEGVEVGMKKIVAALHDGDSILLYPSGRVYRSPEEKIGGNSGVAHILEALPDVRVVLVRTTGLWGSSFSYAANGKAPNFIRSLLHGVGALLANAFFFMPRRKVMVEFVEPANLPRHAGKHALNRWLESFYNQTQKDAEAVPLFFWKGRRPYAIPDFREKDGAGEGVANASRELRESAYAMLRKAAGLTEDSVIQDSMSLGADLGLDSLAMMELSFSAETEFGHPIQRLENIVTVGDFLIAAMGDSASSSEGSPAAAAWFKTVSNQPLEAPRPGLSIVEAFIALALKESSFVVTADRSGVRTRREILTGAVALAKRFRQLSGKRLGIMLPSTPAVVVVWLAAMLAGKEPVFFNWTVGEANLRHCIAMTDVCHVLTVPALLERLERQGFQSKSVPVEWLDLERIAASLSIWEKIRAALSARFMRKATRNVAGIAAVLFTSGSESLPKAVPLTHENLMANARDIIATLRLRADESVLAMLPPFHSFGLMAGLVLPLGVGLRAAYHPNPTESGPLVSLVRDFKLTLLAAPPTFLKAMLDRATGSNALASLRFAFVGAEKCSESVYAAFATLCPQASLCEGYGITECSPVVSVNSPGNVMPGTIGHLLPSVEAVVVKEEEGDINGLVEHGETGMLLVRGPSVFTGYIGEAPDPFVTYATKRWYRTGDLVKMDDTGRLTFCGRLKRFVKVGGEMISLPQIENTLLEAFASLSDTPTEGPILAVEAAPEEFGEMITLFTPMQITATTANSALRKAGLSPLYAIKAVVALEEIPLLGSGKVDYRKLKLLCRERVEIPSA